MAEVRDGIPENKPDPTERAVKMTLDTVSGNLVTLDLGGGRFATYAHLQVRIDRSPFSLGNAVLRNQPP